MAVRHSSPWRVTGLICLLVQLTNTAVSARTYAESPVEVPDLSAADFVQYRLSRYCAWPAFESAAEGAPPYIPGAPRLKLRHATVIMRHGDRSAIHEGHSGLPIAEHARGSWTCDSPSEAELKHAAGLLTPFRSSPDCVLAGQGSVCDGTSFNRSSDGVLTAGSGHALAAWSKARAQGEACGPHGGELSSRGWQQVTAVGRTLGKAYLQLLRQPQPLSTPLQVMATDYGRTALTAAAAVRGLLEPLDTAIDGPPGGVLAAALGPADPPAVQQAMANGPLSRLTVGRSRPGPIPGMHLPLPLHIVPRQDDPLLLLKKVDGCPRARALQEAEGAQMFAHARLAPALAERLSSLTGQPQDNLPNAEELADVAFARLCHGQGLPCFSKKAAQAAPRRRRVPLSQELQAEPEDGAATDEDGPDAADEAPACMSMEDAAAVLKQGDLLYATRFNNSVTRLLSYPLLEQLTRRMVQAVRGQPGYPRMALHAAHDTVLSPLLRVLGLSDGHVAWPGYASWMSLEVWSAGDGPGMQGPPATPLHGASHTQAGTPPHLQLAQEMDREAARRSFVRLTFNGVDWSHRLPCAKPVNTSALARGPGGPGPMKGHRGPPAGPVTASVDAAVAPSEPVQPGLACSLADFQEVVAGLIAPHATWEDACRVEDSDQEEGHQEL